MFKILVAEDDAELRQLGGAFSAPYCRATASSPSAQPTVWRRCRSSSATISTSSSRTS
mgnify:CR=1 FL=1